MYDCFCVQSSRGLICLISLFVFLRVLLFDPMDASEMNINRCVSQTHILTDKNEVSGCTIFIMLIHIVFKKTNVLFHCSSM